MKKTNCFLFISAFFLGFHDGYSQHTSLSFSAYLDTYYAFDFSHPEDNQRMYVTQYDRHNEFNINHAWIKGAYQGDRVRVNLALQTGTYPVNNYSGEPNPLVRMIYEANAGYQVSENSWLDIGVFGGHFGYESALGLERELLSPALSTEYTPYYQTGVRYSNQVTEKLIFRAVLLNGWQNIAETNNSKSTGLAVDYRVNALLWVSYGNYYGNETLPGYKARRFHNNAIVKVTPPGGSLSFIGVLDHTLQKTLVDNNDQVLFVTIISEYSLNEKFSAAARYEFVKDQNAVLLTNPLNAGGSFHTHVLSMAAAFQPEANISFKVEPKVYFSDRDTFGQADGTVKNAVALQAGFAFLVGER